MTEDSGDEVSRFEQEDNGEGVADEDQLSESPLAYLQKFCLSQNLAERQLAVRHILKSLQSLESDRDGVETIFALVKESFVDDKEHVVRTELLEQLPLLCMHCAQSPSLTPYVEEFIIPLVVKFLSDSNSQVRKTCHAAILILVEQELISTNDLEARLVPVLLSLTDYSVADEIRIESVGLHTLFPVCRARQSGCDMWIKDRITVSFDVLGYELLICKFIPTLGNEKGATLILPRFSELCRDQVFHIRKICAATLGEASKVFGQEITEKILVSHLVALSQDTVWGVRKACAECFTDVSLNCSMKIRQRYLASVFIVLLGDSSRWVQSSAFQALGPFISTFADSNRTGLKWIQGQLIYEEPMYPTSSLSSAHMDPSESDHSWPVDVSGIKCNLGSTDGDEEYMDIGELLGVTFVNSDYLESQQRNAAINDISDRGTSVEPTELRISGWKKDECDTADDFTVIFHRRKDGSAKDPEDSLTQIERELDSLSLALNDANRFCPSLQSDTSKTDERSSSGSSDFRSLSNAVVSSDENFSSFEFWRPAIPEIPSSVHSLPISTDESELASFMERRFAFPSTPFNTCLNSERCESAGHQRTVSETTEICQSDSEANKDRNRVNQKATETVSDSLFHPSKLDNCFVVDDTRLNGCSTFGIGLTQRNEKSVGGTDGRPTMKISHDQKVVPQELLDNYLSMVEPSRAQSIETDISQYCAYNLPAVAYTMGRENWSYLKDVYRVLSNDIQWKVRRTLAFSAHQLAAIVGPDITSSDIFPVFTGLLRDVDEVRIGILKHLYDFLKLLDRQHRKVLLASFADFLQTDNYRNWRFRQLLAEQLTLLCQLYELEDLNEYLTPIAMTLAVDKVAEVRMKTYKLVATILYHFYAEETRRKKEVTVVTDKFLDDIVKALANSQRWIRRQTFVYICREVITTRAVPEVKFSLIIMPTLQKLAADRIPNVRIALAKVLLLVGRSGEYFEDSAPVESLMKKLLDDQDKDVRQLADIYYGRSF